MGDEKSALKVVMVVGDFPPLMGGVGDYAACLSRALADRGVGLTVATTRIPGMADREVSNGVEICRIVHRWVMSAIGDIIALVDQAGPGTIVHIQYDCPKTYRRNPMINLLPAIMRLRRPQCPVVVTMHGFQEYRLRWRVRVLPMLLAPNALIVVNERDRQLMGRWIRPRRLRAELIPIASNISVVPEDWGTREAMKRQLGFTQDDIVVAHFGFIRTDKGFMNLLNALQEIRSTDQSLRFLLIGGFDYAMETQGGYPQAIREALSRPEMRNWVTLAAAKEPEDVSRLLQVADVAVFPFTRGASENRGSLLAAIVHGLPTITTRGPSTPLGFEQNFGVETVPADDNAELAAHIRALVQSAEAREELSRRALAASLRFSWDAIARGTISLYESLLHVQ
jgi:polysaccharide biosynthesis protein PslF